ncbi:MAG: lipopolysaccharide biosynthesis protein, partial [Chloroflexia bacterium]|nr:lipopolysaccharide biosynthesis protein [Chloroflexia bacterium]
MLTFDDLWTYLRVLLRWWWVLVLGTVLAASVAFVMASRQPKYYVAQTTLMIGDSLTSATPDAQLIGLSNALAMFYAEMSRREPILGPVTEKLGLPFQWQVISSYMLATSVNNRASLLNITITDTSPERAAALATAIANELIAYSPNSPEKVASQRLLIQEQLTQVQANLALIDQTIEETREMQARSSGAADLREARSRIEELELTRESTQDTYNQLIRIQNGSVANTLAVLEPAQVPTQPLPDKRMLTVAMAGAGGFILAALAAFVLDMLDDRWRSANDLRSRFGMPSLGLVPGRRPLITLKPGSALQREMAIREAHTNIVLAAMEQGSGSLMISSPTPSEARSAFSIDLAQLFTRSGYSVLLVDADMEQPILTRMLVGDNPEANGTLYTNGKPEIWSRMYPTMLKNVLLLAHNVGPDGVALTPSLPWSELVEHLKRVADIVIFDGPSTLPSVDAALLAPLVDGVVLTLNPAYDNRTVITESKARLTRKRKTNLLGAVMLTEEVLSHPAQTQYPWLPLVK